VYFNLERGTQASEDQSRRNSTWSADALIQKQWLECCSWHMTDRATNKTCQSKERFLDWSELSFPFHLTQQNVGYFKDILPSYKLSKLTEGVKVDVTKADLHRKTEIHHNTNTHPFNGPFSGTTQVSRYQKGNTNPDFTEARQWVAVASGGPYASLHLVPDRQPHQHPTTLFFTCRMPFLPPNQQRQSTEGN